MTPDHSGTGPFFSIQTPKNQKTYNFFKKSSKKFGSFKKVRTFAIPNEKYGSYAEIAQLVEHNLAKVGVASSSLVFRSKRGRLDAALNFETPDVVQLYAGRPLLRSAFFFIYRPLLSLAISYLHILVIRHLMRYDGTVISVKI